MVEKVITVQNRAGIHARPAAMIVQTAGQFKSDIQFCMDEEAINAKSIMGVITLGASYKSEITISAEGEDAEEAVAALTDLFEKQFADK